MRGVYYNEFGPAEVLKLGDLTMPEPAPDEVLVKVAYAGVNPIDRRLRSGELQDFFTREWPLTPGWDVSGRIVKVGRDVKGWKAGDDIVGLAFTWNLHHGTYAEFVPVKAASIAAKPAEIPFHQAAALPLVSLTAWESLAEYAELKPGQTVLIQAGAGGLGSAAITIAKHLGAKIYTTTRTENFDYVRSRGADHPIDYTREDYMAVIKAREPGGLDVILESLLVDVPVEADISLVKPGGTVIYMNNEPPDMPEIARNQIKTKFLHHRPDGESLGRLMKLYQQGKLALPPVEVLPLDAAVEAHKRSEGGRTRGKLVLKVLDL
ncbi:MAG: NADPH:quinone reductase [Gammaproteobacteria bacterium RIFCSPLOWO2_02_FULL_61_13]|nr:MAG: NADPH:quinone reductase [Gammaproteobacteria bacterium RIFCSPLOWO2_02_FULL_61_13]